MTNPVQSTPSFLRDAFSSYAPYTAPQKQDMHRRALKWLKTHIEAELSQQKIMEQFTQKWRTGTNQSLNSDNSELHLENLVGSYKGNKSINLHQEDALAFLEENVPQQLQDEFKKRWSLQKKLEVSNSSGTPFKINEKEIEILKQEDPDGNGTTWYQVNNKEIFYLLSSELKNDQYLVVLSEEISPQNRNTWFVAQADVKISDI